MKKFTDSVLETEIVDEKDAGSHSARSGQNEEDSQMLVKCIYSEYKQQFEARNMDRVFRIVKKLEEVKPDTPILHLMRGEIYLLGGNGDHSFEELFNYLSRAETVDGYGLSVIARWNQAAGYFSESLSQHCEALQDRLTIRQKMRTLVNAVKCKKGLQFLDTALSYYNRILALPEGYSMIPYVLLDVIHIHILKKNYMEAKNAIAWYNEKGSCIFLVRLKALLSYLTNNVDEIIELSYDSSLEDPYIMYLVGRTAFENEISSIDWDRYFVKAVKLAKHNAYFYVSRGNALFKVGNLRGAIESYNSALSIDPLLEHANHNNEALQKALAGLLYSEVVDVVPDIEKLGFFYTQELFGYSSFRLKTQVPKKLFYVKGCH